MKYLFLFSALCVWIAPAASLAQDNHQKAAVKAAALQADIMQTTNHSTGDVQFLKKKVCAVSGVASYERVEYCSKTNKFVEATTERKKGSCTKSRVAWSAAHDMDVRATLSKLPAYCTAAQRAAAATATRKTAVAKADYTANANNRVRP